VLSQRCIFFCLQKDQMCACVYVFEATRIRREEGIHTSTKKKKRTGGA
jgi:hypothetical protein